MWSKIKNIFGKKEDSQNYNLDQGNLVETQSDSVEIHTDAINVESETTPKPNKSNDEKKPLSTGLAIGDAIAMLIYEHGYDFVLSGNVYNALSDYGAFQQDKARRTIFKTLVSEGIFKELLSLTTNDNLDNKILQYTQYLTSNFGYDSLIINSVICEVLYGIALISENDCKSKLQEYVRHDDSKELLESSDQEKPSASTNIKLSHPFNPSQGYKYPSIDVLPSNKLVLDYDSELERGKKRIEWVLASQGITINDIKGYPSPRISTYEIDIDPRKLSKVMRNEKVILSALSPAGSRILNPIPGKTALGIELPNDDKYELSLRDVVETSEFTNTQYDLPIAIGMNSTGSVIIKDLTKLPHLLICGEMQQGKTSLVRQILASLLIKKTFEEVKFTLIDTCSLELQNFKQLCGYWMAQSADNDDYSVIYGINEGMKILQEYLMEIECRKVLFNDAEVSNIKEYNEKYCLGKLDPSKGHQYLPYLILVCDEIAPLVSSNTRKFESLVSSLISSAINTGIHCIFTTKYTSTDTLTPSIRANFPVRITFRINLPNESKLVTGSNVATNLLDNGDAVISENGIITRIQSAKCDPEDIQPLIDKCTKFCQLDLPYTLPDSVINLTPPSIATHDLLLEDAARFIVSTGSTASTSMLQRRYCIGYNRAGKIMDELESIGVVGQAIGSKPRSVLVDAFTLESIFAKIR